MKISKIPGLGRFGIIIDDVDFNTITEEEWMEIGQLHMQNLVTVIRNHNLPWNKMRNWVERFGDQRYNQEYQVMKKYGKDWPWCVEQTLNDTALMDEVDKVRMRVLANMVQEAEQDKYILRVSGKVDEHGNATGMFADGELLWHSNESGTLTFTPGVALFAAENVVGSATGFMTTTDWYESVSESQRSELNELVIVHKFTPGKINPGMRYDQDEVMHGNMCPVDGVEIPLVVQSPGGITGLHYSPNTCYSVKGMSDIESREFFEYLEKELFVEKYTYDHWYKNDNDLLFFDNSITQHRRLGDIKNRLCYRIQQDYSKLQNGKFWQPYFQEPYASRYVEQITDVVNVLNLENFILPK
ncbi:TauD/TfdA-like domain containing protein [uncultured Caudovirales phage]|uniref:TauD/TfdA-like domain containing protein n=1 Tax=uncultured Caudovirales phage TaxID=2100421 RepID=A0A6J5KXH0_9CAUD|nr:TauD/TfdA-like domain containing protein [uncultured Caudovirales phage]CAB5208797.1 TauD/TfdA-like domain containing protein [uncultured Caudovirales phage]